MNPLKVKAHRLWSVFFPLMAAILLRIAIPTVWANPELIKAIEEGNIKKIEQLIKQGVDLNALITIHEDELLTRKQTPLFIAINNTGISHQENIKLVNFLLENGALPNIYGLENEHPKTLPLFAAVQYERHEVVKLLLQYGADISLTSFFNSTILCMTTDDTPMLEILLQAGAGSVINAVDNLGWTALSNAALYGATDSFKLLLQSTHLKPETLNAVHNGGKTALHLACQLGHLAIVELILNHDYFNSTLIDLHDQAGHSPLQLAVNNHHHEIAALLIQHGATPIEQTESILLSAENQQDETETSETQPLLEQLETLLLDENLPSTPPGMGLMDSLPPGSH